MPLPDLSDPSAVELAISEFDRLGRRAFLTKYSFGKARGFFLLHHDRPYDSKAIAGAAHGFQFPDLGPLTKNDYSGGEKGAARILQGLGFTVKDYRLEHLNRDNPYYKPAAVLAGLQVHHDGWVEVEPFREAWQEIMDRYQPGRSDKWWEPFYHLRNDGMWELYQDETISEFANLERSRPKGARALREAANCARFLPPYLQWALNEPELLERQARSLLDRSRIRYWALLANPRTFRIEAAIHHGAIGDWLTAGKKISSGDHVLIWRASGGRGPRGAVAFGEVLEDPIERPGDPIFWVDPEEANRSEPRVRVKYDIPDGLPLWLDDHSDILGNLNVARARGGSVFELERDDWLAITEASQATVPSSSAPAPLGSDYVNADEDAESAPPVPRTPDHDATQRGIQAHARIQNALAEHLRGRGIEPRSPSPHEPPYDLAWEVEGVTYVAEVKSTTLANEEKQLRLGLGQVLRYRQQMNQRYEEVVAVLVAEQEPADESWIETCEVVCVRLTWPPDFLLQ